jgi:hypothetical protein
MKKILKQVELQNAIIQLAKINIVTCGNCGSVVLHKTKDTEIDCPYCDRIMDVCDCPDYLYNGIENNQVY